jgi:hypothetical protein
LVILAGGVAAQTVSHEEAHRKAEELLKKMTVDEKVGQLNQSSGVTMPFLGSQKPDDLISQGKVGSVLWLIDVKEINRLQHIAVEKTRLHIPILFAFDVIHGYRTVFPVPLAMASSWDPSVEEAGAAAGRLRTRARRGSIGRSPRWWTLRGTRGGDALWKARARIRTWARRWRGRR